MAIGTNIKIDNETRERAKVWVSSNLKKDTEQEKDVNRDLSKRDYTVATKMAVKVIKQFEGYSLYSYPDPQSGLYKILSQHNKLKSFMDGSNRDIPEEWGAIEGFPYTCGYGETEGVTKNTVYSVDEAESRLFSKVSGLVTWVIKKSPKLQKHSDEKIASVVSLIYNIGEGNYSQSTVYKKIDDDDMKGAADAFLMLNKAKGQIMQGLINRRSTERGLFLSIVN